MQPKTICISGKGNFGNKLLITLDMATATSIGITTDANPKMHSSSKNYK
jgi:hypothetical protein